MVCKHFHIINSILIWCMPIKAKELSLQWRRSSTIIMRWKVSNLLFLLFRQFHSFNSILFHFIRSGQWPEFKEVCEFTTDCRRYAYVCRAHLCECADGYRPDVRNATCVGGIYRGHEIFAFFFANLQNSILKRNWTDVYVRQSVHPKCLLQGATTLRL